MRQATEGDIPVLIERLRRFHGASGLASRFDPDASAGFLRGIIAAGVVLISDRGCIGGVIAPHWCSPSWRMAVEMFWHADGDGMALLRGFEDWAREQGADEVRMTSLASLPRADRILRARGYAPAEISYSRGL